MKPGFTLIEIILATALAAMISTALIVMLGQMNTTLVRVDRVSDVHMRAAILQNQMERDLAGAFAPADFSATTTTGETKPGSPKKIEKIFWADNTLETLTFITNNPLQSYWGERSGKPQPKIVRVIYRLIPDEKHKNRYVLMRQESSDLYATDFQANSVNAYPMIEGIKSVELEYTALIKKDETKGATVGQSNSPKNTTGRPEEQPEEQVRPQEEFDRQRVKEWKNNVIDQKPAWPLIPQFVTMHVILWDDTLKNTTPFTFEFQIIPRFESADQKEIQEQKSSGFGIGALLGVGNPQ
jgi:prepilin-type N-terminal cleavage/methylation domain-containing protein